MNDQPPILRPIQAGEALSEPPSEATDLKRARKRLSEATALLSAGELDRATSQIRKACVLAPNDGATLARAAVLHLRISQIMYSQAHSVDPTLQDPKSENVAAQEDYGRRLSELADRLENAPIPVARVAPLMPAPWPNKAIVWKDLDRVFRRYVLAETAPEPGIITQQSRVLTMGSCFARNISRRLATHGVQVLYQQMKEELNTTFANERIVRWAIEGPTARDGVEIEQELGADARATLREALQACDVYVFSLGVAPTFFDAQGEYVLSLTKGSAQGSVAGATIRTSTPNENAKNVLQIIEMLRSLNPNVQVFLTLSPVPLAGSSERKSAILADCVSKSSLRLAVEAVMAANIPGVRYWPSFEMAKWWGAHLVDRNAFAEDGESRHVSPWMVDSIIDLFVEYYGDGEISLPAA